MNELEKEFIPYEQALELKELGFDKPCLGYFDKEDENSLKCDVVYDNKNLSAPIYRQAINFLYICSNKQIDIELKGSDTHEERIRKIEQGCKDLWNLQNNKSK